MGKASVHVTWTFPDFLRAFDKSFDRIEKAIASTIQTQAGMRFDMEGASNGHEKWSPLRMRTGQILSLSGALRRSLSPPNADGNPGQDGYVQARGTAAEMDVEVGTKLIYASTHNDGAVIVPVNKRSLRYVNPGTGKVVFSKKSVIPKRNFTDLNENDKQEIEETVANVLKDIFESAT